MVSDFEGDELILLRMSGPDDFDPLRWASISQDTNKKFEKQYEAS